MVNRIVDFFLAGKILIALIFLAAVAGFTILIPKLGFHIELHSLLKSDSKQKGSELGAFYRTFPPVEGEAKIAVSFDRPVTVADLIKTREWVAELEDLPEVKRVISTFGSLLETKYGEFTLEEWVELAGAENDPVTLGTSPGVNFVHGTFISKDFQSLAFYIQRARSGFGEFMDALRDTSAGWGDTTRVMSLNFMLLEGRDLLKKELGHLLLLLLIALFLLLPLILRSFRTAFLPLGIALFSVMTFMSVLVLFDQPITLVLIAAPILVMVIGLSNSIHLQRYFDSARSGGATVRQALVKMFQDGGMACFMTSLTTAIGFFSLLIVSHEEIRGFGFWCGIGVLISYINIILFFPVLLSLIPGKIRPNRTYAFANPARLRKYVVPVTVCLLLLVGGIAFVRLDTSLYEEMPQNNEAVRNMQWFSEHFRGTERIEIEVKGPLNQLEVFNSVDRLQDELGQLGGIEGVSSYVSLLRYISPPGLLDTEEGLPIAMRALRSLPEYPENLLTRKENHGCIVFHISDRFGSAQFKKFKERFDELQPGLSPKAEFKLNGYVSMAYDSINYIAESLLYSLGISIAFITLALIIYLRSAPLAIICLIPNVLPIMVTLGLAGWLRIPVSVGMIVIFMIGLGIAVDDTVHLVIKFLQSRKKNKSGSIREHLDEAVSSTGFAIFLTSIVILAAAVTFLQSSFSTLRETGIVLSTVTIAAILADLFVFPWIIEKYFRFVHRFKKTP